MHTAPIASSVLRAIRKLMIVGENSTSLGFYRGSAVYGLLVWELGKLDLMMHIVFPRYLVLLFTGNLKALGSEVSRGPCTVSLHFKSTCYGG